MKTQQSRSIDTHSLILSHREGAMKICRKILRKWGVTLEEDEVRSLADVALCEAAKGFNHKKGAQFVTYLYFFAKGELAREIGRRTKREMPIELDKPCSMKKVERELINSEANLKLVCPEGELAVKEVRAKCREALEALSELERQVMLRVHVYDFKVASVARSLGYSRGYLSDVKRVAATKMQSYLEPYRECLAA